LQLRGVARNLLKGTRREPEDRGPPAGSKGIAPPTMGAAVKPPEAGGKYGCRLYRNAIKIQNIPIRD